LAKLFKYIAYTELMEKTEETEIIEKIKVLRERGTSDAAIRRELGLSPMKFYYLLGKGGLGLRPRPEGGTTLRTAKGKPYLLASATALRVLGWPVGQRVRWRVEAGKLVGEPVG